MGSTRRDQVHVGVEPGRALGCGRGLEWQWGSSARLGQSLGCLLMGDTLREVVESPSLNVIKNGLDAVLRDTI